MVARVKGRRRRELEIEMREEETKAEKKEGGWGEDNTFILLITNVGRDFISLFFSYLTHQTLFRSFCNHT